MQQRSARKTVRRALRTEAGNNMLMHSFTKREKIVLVILAIALVAGFYFLAIHYPVNQRLEEIKIEKAEVEDQTTLAMAKAQRYRTMQKELDEIFALSEDEITVMPPFDNKQTLTYIFNDVFADTAPNLRFADVKTDGNIATRSISFTFNADSYDAAKEILIKLTGTGYRCLLQNVTLAPTNGDVEYDGLTVSGNIVFYELIG